MIDSKQEIQSTQTRLGLNTVTQAMPSALVLIADGTEEIEL